MNYEFEEKTNILMMIADSECGECYQVSVHEFKFKLMAGTICVRISSAALRERLTHDASLLAIQPQATLLICTFFFLLQCPILMCHDNT